MKIMRPISILAVTLLIASGFLPWAYIDFGKLHHAVLTGMNTGATNYGKPAVHKWIILLIFIFLCRVSLD